MKIDELVVQSGNCEFRLPVQLPDGPPLFYMLNCKGIGMLAGGNGRARSVVAQVDRELVRQGALMAYFSLRDYAKSVQSPSISSAAFTIGEIAGQMEKTYGAQPYAIGHSFGGFAVMKAAMSQGANFEGVVLLNTPISNNEPLSSITRHWMKMRGTAKSMAAAALCKAMSIDHHGAPVAVVERALGESLERQASITGPFSYRPILILYGERDVYQFRDAGILAIQTCEGYKQRWNCIAPQATVLGYDGLGHNFSSGFMQQISVMLGYRPPQVSQIAAEILRFVNA